MITRVLQRARANARATHAALCAAVILAAVGAASLLTWQRAPGHRPSFGVAAHAAAEDVPLTEGFAPYLYRKNGQAADPVNIMFRTSDGKSAAKAVRDVLGWLPVSSTPMNFIDADKTRPTGWQFYLPLDAGARFHLRIESVTPADGRDYVLAAVHHDLLADCGHLGTAFDAMRDYVAHAFTEAGYRVETTTLGNTQPGRQCNGTFTAGDGRVAVIDLTRP
jgi:hypothetical protein